MTDDHDDFAFEPVPGLPDHLPKGESMLWQGSPEWRALAVSAFHVRKVAVYFGVILAWQFASAYGNGAPLRDMAISSAWTVGIGMAAIAILSLLAFLYARGTIYTLTSRRIVIRSGLALPVTLNLPLALIGTAALGKRSTGAASIALTVLKPNRVAFLVLWPNARPGYFNNPQPMLRCLADAESVAAMLANALEEDAGFAKGRAPVRAGVAAQGEPTHAPIGATFAA